MNALSFYRVARVFKRARVPIIPQMLCRCAYVLFNAHIPASAEIGAGTRLGYGGMGIVIHSRARIGKNCLISQQVTIGGKSGRADVPCIGADVYIGAGAKLLGPIQVGAGSVIGANAVVVKDVPSRCVVAGVPAKVIATDINSADYF